MEELIFYLKIISRRFGLLIIFILFFKIQQLPFCVSVVMQNPNKMRVWLLLNIKSEAMTNDPIICGLQ